jgi:hypothetical protein
MSGMHQHLGWMLRTTEAKFQNPIVKVNGWVRESCVCECEINQRNGVLTGLQALFAAQFCQPWQRRNLSPRISQRARKILEANDLVPSWDK